MKQNKARRNELTQLKYKKRVRRYVANLTIYVNSEGEYLYNPKTVDIIEDHGQLRYKTMATPCSCYCCSGYYKYRRHEKKAEDRQLIKEALSEDSSGINL